MAEQHEGQVSRALNSELTREVAPGGESLDHQAHARLPRPRDACPIGRYVLHLTDAAAWMAAARGATLT